MIRFLEEATDQAKAEGCKALRGTGEMTWYLGGDPGTEKLIEYEVVFSKGNFWFEVALSPMRDASGYSNDPIMTDFDKYGFRGMVKKLYGICDLEKVLQNVITEKETL